MCPWAPNVSCSQNDIVTYCSFLQKYFAYTRARSMLLRALEYLHNCTVPRRNFCNPGQQLLLKTHNNRQNKNSSCCPHVYIVGGMQGSEQYAKVLEKHCKDSMQRFNIILHYINL